VSTGGKEGPEEGRRVGSVWKVLKKGGKGQRRAGRARGKKAGATGEQQGPKLERGQR
jgi:hypothetical protein